MTPLRPSDIKYLVVHCSGSRCDRPFTVEGLVATGMERFGQPSYHYYVRRDGSIVRVLPETVRGVHARHFNHCSLAICYEGGLDEQGEACDTRTEAQKHALYALLKSLHDDYPEARILGHCELPRVGKPCPCFKPSQEYADLNGQE